MGGVIPGQIGLGYVGNQAEQALGSKSLSYSSVVSALAHVCRFPSELLHWLPSVRDHNLTMQQILTSPKWVLIVGFITATRDTLGECSVNGSCSEFPPGRLDWEHICYFGWASLWRLECSLLTGELCCTYREHLHLLLIRKQGPGSNYFVLLVHLF